MITFIIWLTFVILLWHPMYERFLKSEGVHDPDGMDTAIYGTGALICCLFWPIVGVFVGVFRLSRFAHRRIAALFVKKGERP